MSVFVFLHDGYADWELGYLLPELQTPSPTPGVEKRCRSVVTFGLGSGAVTSLGGLVVQPQRCLRDVRPAEIDALILPGGIFWETFKEPPLDALVRETAACGAVLGAICAATGYLAQLGLLDDLRHSSNSLDFLRQRAPAYRGECLFQPDLATADRGLVTASGLGAVDFTYRLLLALEVYPREVCGVWLDAFKHGQDPFARSARAEQPPT